MQVNLDTLYSEAMSLLTNIHQFSNTFLTYVDFNFISTVLSSIMMLDISNNLLYFFFYICIFYVLTVFFSSSSFLKLLLSIVFVVLCGILLGHYNLDFFSGFLLTAEFPMLLVAFLFFFQKNSLAFDNVYTLNNRGLQYFLFLFLGLFGIHFFSSNQTLRFLYNVYDFELNTALQIQHINDFFVYYTIYYCLYPIYVLLLALIIFIVSYIVIVVFYTFKFAEKAKSRKTQNLSFLRKQNLMRQPLHMSKLNFFKKK